MWWMSGTIPPVYLREYFELIQCCMSSAYALFSAAALRLAGAKTFLLPRLIWSRCNSQRSGVDSSADVISRNSWTTCSGLDSAWVPFRSHQDLNCYAAFIFTTARLYSDCSQDHRCGMAHHLGWFRAQCWRMQMQQTSIWGSLKSFHHPHLENGVYLHVLCKAYIYQQDVSRSSIPTFGLDSTSTVRGPYTA